MAIRGDRRRQLKPSVATAGALACFYVAALTYRSLTAQDELGGPLLSGVILAVTLSCLPCALGIAVLRHRLFGIKVVVHRVAAAMLLSALLLGVYATVAALVAMAAGGGGIQWRALLATGATVAALGPLYRFARSVIDRLMYGDRDRPDRVLRSLAMSLGEAVDPLCAATAHRSHHLRRPPTTLRRTRPDVGIGVGPVGGHR